MIKYSHAIQTTGNIIILSLYQSFETKIEHQRSKHLVSMTFTVCLLICTEDDTVTDMWDEQMVQTLY